MDIKVVGLASDHAGFALKTFVKQYLTERNIPFKDYGTNSEESCDYPDSGEGIAITLNKHQCIRAGLAWAPEIAHLIRQHNNANVLVMPGRFINQETAKKILDEFFETDFEGGRHQNRIDKIPVKE